MLFGHVERDRQRHSGARCFLSKISSNIDFGGSKGAMEPFGLSGFPEFRKYDNPEIRFPRNPALRKSAIPEIPDFRNCGNSKIWNFELLKIAISGNPKICNSGNPDFRKKRKSENPEFRKYGIPEIRTSRVLEMRTSEIRNLESRVFGKRNSGFPEFRTSGNAEIWNLCRVLEGDCHRLWNRLDFLCSAIWEYAAFA